MDSSFVYVDRYTKKPTLIKVREVVDAVKRAGWKHGVDEITGNHVLTADGPNDHGIIISYPIGDIIDEVTGLYDRIPVSTAWSGDEVARWEYNALQKLFSALTGVVAASFRNFDSRNSQAEDILTHVNSCQHTFLRIYKTTGTDIVGQDMKNAGNPYVRYHLIPRDREWFESIVMLTLGAKAMGTITKDYIVDVLMELPPILTISVSKILITCDDDDIDRIAKLLDIPLVSMYEMASDKLYRPNEGCHSNYFKSIIINADGCGGDRDEIVRRLIKNVVRLHRDDAIGKFGDGPIESELNDWTNATYAAFLEKRGEVEQ